MKIFRTELKQASSSVEIPLGSTLFATGSCFAQAIGSRLLKNKFKVLTNPQGTLYSPLAIHKALRYCIHNELPIPSTYVENNDVWSNFEFHSSLSALSKSDAEKSVRESIGMTHHFLTEADILLITYGTAFVHYRSDTGEPVANCHKLPSSKFTKDLLQPEEIVNSFKDLHKTIKQRRPSIRIILTVSPVRHLRDTLELNSVSKSSLRLACHTLAEDIPGVEYFPAYEIMVDDLRDYRFYKSDLIHPSEDAIDYIWEKFCDKYFSTKTRNLLAEWQSIMTALEHRPFHKGALAHQKFLQETLHRLKELKHFLPVEEEVQRITEQLMTPHV